MEKRRVKLNAIEGLLSFERARDMYGVVLIQKEKDDPETIEVDYQATEELREKGHPYHI